jgi:hypothetical protein
MNGPSIVLIAGRDRLETLKARVSPAGDVLALTESDVPRVVEILATRRPSQFILERFFAATPRGVALITRLRTDPSLADLEIRVAAHDSDYSRIVTHQISEPPPGEPPLPREGSSSEEEPAPHVMPSSLDPGGTRHSARFAAPDGVEVQIDGKPVTLLDLSESGAQVTSATMLRPNQWVRVSITWQEDTARVGATIAWANFEMSKEAGRPQYRAGVAFNQGESDVIEALMEKWRD